VRDGDSILIDARAPERFRGEVEPLDRIAGRIPGARNAYHMDTLDLEGYFLAKQGLRRRFEDVLQGSRPDRAILYCGSGVSAAQNLLAMAHAGMPGAKLYAGSWSEWITDPAHAIAAGPDENRKG
jgi:thiosulfate/3-mercaptopyruvate sulfurtransferase